MAGPRAVVSPHAVRANGSIACVVHSPCWGLNFSFVRTGNVAAGGSLAGSLITPYVRGPLGVGGWEGWLSVDPLVLCVCSERASASVGDGLARSLLFLGYNLQ